LGIGTPIAFLLSSDAQKVYIVVQNSPTIQVFDLLTQLPSTLSLVGSPNPLAAALAPDGQTLYVSASDGKVHFIDTISGGDAYQVDVPPSSLCTITTGGTQPNCLPDLLAVRP
jgi:DNA-binding beta-propeller fold protein YncE